MARNREPEDEPEENTDSSANDDTFGLPDIEYEPLNREATREPEEPSAEPQAHTPEPRPEINQSGRTEEKPVTHTPMDRDAVPENQYNSPYYDEDESNSPWPKILGIAALLLVIGAAIWYFGFHQPRQAAAAREKARQEEEARQQASHEEEARRQAEQQRMAEEARRKADSLASATPTAGTIETLNGRTGRYYVVVASAIDGDLLMDYAKELSGNGVNVKIIPPFGNVKFHRLTVAEGDSFAAAQQTAESLKGKYTDKIWVIKY